MTKIVAISDMHGHLPEIPRCDLFIIAGDICPSRNHTRPFQSNWLTDTFNPWLKNLPAKNKVIIAGNHDWIFYDSKNMVPKLDCIYLENSGVEIEGIRLYGSPFSRFFCDWAFNFPENDTQGITQKTWDAIPDDTDILITHGPAFGYGDLSGSSKYGFTCQRDGDPILLEAVKRVKPKWFFFGHFHEGCATIDNIEKLEHPDGKITYCCNVSILDNNYVMTKQPTIVDY